MHCLAEVISSVPQQVALLQPSTLLWFLGIRFCVDKMQIIPPSMGCCL